MTNSTSNTNPKQTSEQTTKRKYVRTAPTKAERIAAQKKQEEEMKFRSVIKALEESKETKQNKEMTQPEFQIFPIVQSSQGHIAQININLDKVKETSILLKTEKSIIKYIFSSSDIV